jgi:hypothetical protein
MVVNSEVYPFGQRTSSTRAAIAQTFKLLTREELAFFI